MSTRHRPDEQRLTDLLPRPGLGLPPGQRELFVFPRFSDQPLRRPPRLPDAPEVTICGAVEQELTLPLPALAELVAPRELVADFHCVTTWSTRGLRWDGVPFARLWREVVPRCVPAEDATCIVVHGLDHARATVMLDDALEDDVLLADRLDGTPLTAAHGAPLRFVTPKQYGYKNVKHVHRIEVHRKPPASAYGRKEHLLARVALEERHSTRNARMLRLLYRPVVPLAAWLSGQSALQP